MDTSTASPTTASPTTAAATTAPPNAEAAQLPLERLEAEITTLAGHLDAGTCRWLLLVAELDRREGWAGWGVLSCAHWLMWRCGLSIVAARERVRVARALDDLPVITAAFSRGELSYSKVRALTRVAKPATEAQMCELGRQATTSQLERLVRVYRRAAADAGAEDEAGSGAHGDDQRAARAEDRRQVSWYYDDDGDLVLKARLPAERGALVLAALAAMAGAAGAGAGHDSGGSSAGAAGAARPQAGAAGGDDQADRPSVAQRRADALVSLAEVALAAGPVDSPAHRRHQVVVHVDAQVLAASEAAGACELEGGPGLAPEVARRLACDGAITTVVQDAQGSPLDVGRRTRAISSGMRQALRVRDQGCRFPACTNTAFVDGHHVQHWAKGGRTELANLICLCRRHHRSVHEGGFSLSNDAATDAVAVTRPDGTPVPGVFEPVALSASLVDQHRALGLDIGRRPVPRAGAASASTTAWPWTPGWA